VGSTYSFCKDHHGVPDDMLALNYQSNTTIVELCRGADYRRELTGVQPNLKLNLLAPIPTNRPEELFWPSGWARLISLELPAVRLNLRA
jgi:hypothetical protein